MARLPAGVRKRENGILEKRFTIKGTRYSVYATTSKDIIIKEQEIRNKIESNIYTDNHNITLDGYFSEWLQGKRATTKSNSLKTYSSCYKKHISHYLGKTKIKDIERRQIMYMQNELRKTLAITSVNMVLKTLRIILGDAIRDDIITRNPAAGVKALKESEKATETYHRALTLEEQKIFMHEMENDYYYEFVSFLLCSGMRFGEVGALTWKDIDYKNNVIHITKTLTFDENGVMIVGETPKTSAGRRDITLTSTLKKILTKQKSKVTSIFGHSSQVFVAIEGGYVRNRAINSSIAAALKRLDKNGIHIDHFTGHALRDTYATRYIEQGGNMQTLKTILGHSSLAMTMDLYSHVLPDTKQKESENIKFDIAL